MDYCIVNADGIIENIIVADESFAVEIGALPSYDGAAIGGAYAPPEPEPEPKPEPEVDPVTQVYNELDAAYQTGYQKGVNAAYDE